MTPEELYDKVVAVFPDITNLFDYSVIFDKAQGVLNGNKTDVFIYIYPVLSAYHEFDEEFEMKAQFFDTKGYIRRYFFTISKAKKIFVDSLTINEVKLAEKKKGERSYWICIDGGENFDKLSKEQKNLVFWQNLEYRLKNLPNFSIENEQAWVNIYSE